jgi:hypothetical protein
LTGHSLLLLLRREADCRSDVEERLEGDFRDHLGRLGKALAALKACTREKVLDEACADAVAPGTLVLCARVFAGVHLLKLPVDLAVVLVVLEALKNRAG